MDARVSKLNSVPFAVTTPIGIDIDESCHYSLAVTFERVPGADHLELSFYVNETYTSRNEEHSVNCFSGMETHYFSREDRSEILSLLLESVSSFLKLVKADTVVMNFSDGLPIKAVVKYEKICTLFLKSGYVVEILTAIAGTRSWRFDKLGLFLGSAFE